MKTEYKYHRQRGRNAADALRLAREDIAEGKKRYPRAGSAWNPPWSAFGESAMRWIENPSECGLRFVGYADDLTRLNHTGWYTDESQCQTVRGIVYQLPARKGSPLFVCGYADPDNGTEGREWSNPAALSMDVIHGESGYFSTSPRDNPDAADAGRMADRITEIMADSAREYDEVNRARHDFEDCGTEIIETRRAALALIADIKRIMRACSITNGSAACLALRETLTRKLNYIRAQRGQRETLVCDYGSHDGWNDY